MPRQALLNSLCAAVIALVLGTAHLLGPSDHETTELLANELAAAPIEVASLQHVEQSAARAGLRPASE